MTNRIAVHRNHGWEASNYLAAAVITAFLTMVVAGIAAAVDSDLGVLLGAVGASLASVLGTIFIVAQGVQSGMRGARREVLIDEHASELARSDP
ncbi:MAG: hypothetical protein JWR35_162 [Marmoricola sp.]|nr:hypothetical protein [Marmoricola sp.]